MKAPCPDFHLPSILFTSAGRRVELIRAFQEAAARIPDARVVIADCDPLAPTMNLEVERRIVPRLDDPSYAETLLKLCRREDVRAVLPLIDPDVAALNSLRPRLESLGARVYTVAPSATETVSDKWLTREFFDRIGIRSPRSWLPDDLDSIEAEYPVFLKPRRGSAAEGAAQARDRKELEYLLARTEDPIIQELLPGPEITCDVVADHQGTVFAVAQRKRLAVRGGEVTKGVTVNDPAVAEACLHIASELPVTGPITVQCMMKDGGAHFTEINGRMGGGIPLALAAGLRFPDWILARALDRDTEPSGDGTYREGMYMTRFDESFFLTDEDRDTIARRRL